MNTKSKLTLLSDDLCFKKVFSNKEILEDFLNSFFKYLKSDLTYDYSDIKFQSGIMPNSKYYKLYYGDITCTLNTGDMIDLEIYKNTLSVDNYNKSYSYMCRLYSNQKPKSKKYADFKKVYSINLISNNYQKQNKELINIYGMNNLVTNKKIDENITMYLIRFDIVKNIRYTKEEERFITWLRLIGSESEEEMEKYVEGDRIMTDTMRIVKEWNAEENLHTLDDYIEEKYCDKIEESRQDEKSKTLLETAKNMLLKNISITDIMEITGLSKKEINKLQKN